jgi:hypothetical protein
MLLTESIYLPEKIKLKRLGITYLWFKLLLTEISPPILMKEIMNLYEELVTKKLIFVGAIESIFQRIMLICNKATPEPFNIPIINNLDIKHILKDFIYVSANDIEQERIKNSKIETHGKTFILSDIIFNQKTINVEFTMKLLQELSNYLITNQKKFHHIDVIIKQ